MYRFKLEVIVGLVACCTWAMERYCPCEKCRCKARLNSIHLKQNTTPYPITLKFEQFLVMLLLHSLNINRHCINIHILISKEYLYVTICMKPINLIFLILSIIRNRYAHSPRVVYTYVMNIINNVYYMGHTGCTQKK